MQLVTDSGEANMPGLVETRHRICYVLVAQQPAGSGVSLEQEYRTAHRLEQGIGISAVIHEGWTCKHSGQDVRIEAVKIR
jgi:hypothetical protein